MIRALLFLTAMLLQAQPSTRPITISYGASPSQGVTGYNVYKATVSGGPYSKLTATPITGLSYTDPAVAIGSAVYYVATAVGPTCTNPPTVPCGESGYSVEAGLSSVPARATAPGSLVIIVQ